MTGNLVRALGKSPSVKKISAGIIKTNLPNLQGPRRIKIIDQGACLLLRIRGNISQQEVRVYWIDKEMVRDEIQEYAREHNLRLQG